MEEVDAWAATAGTDGLLGQPTGLANTAWRSKRQRTLPAQLQQQHLQPAPAAPPADTPSTQHDRAGHPTAPTLAAISGPSEPHPDLLQKQPHGQWSLTAAAAPAPAATSWHQKSRQPQPQPQRQQQQLDLSALHTTNTQQNPQPPSSLQAGGSQYQHINSSSRGFGVAADHAGRGHAWDGLWGDEGGSQGTASFQQQQQPQRRQQQELLWGDDAEGGTDQQCWDGEYGEQQQQQEEEEESEQEEGGGGWSEEGEGDAGPSQWQEQQQQRQQQEEDADGGCDEAGEGTGDEGTEGEEEEAEEEEEEVQLESADFDLSREEVIGRIEQLAFDLISTAAAGQLPTLSCVSTAASNVHMAPRHSLMATQAGATQRGATQGLRSSSLGMLPCSDEEDEAEAAGEGGSFTQQQQQQQQQQGQHVLRLGSKVQTKSLLASNGAQANGIVRALQLLDNVHGVLRAGRNSTQRDVYYNLVGRPGFQATRDVSTAIHSVLGMLRVPRSALGISAASKGAVAGCLLLRGRPGEAWVDCRTVGPSGRPIPGEVGAVDGTALRSAGARFILVVEKDAVFQSLVESRLHQQLPCILITGRGMPDVASRAFLAAVVEASRGWGGAAASTAAGGSASLSSQWQQQQGLPVLGLVDWNPGGVGILLAYKYGCAALGLESARYAVPSLCWLGVTSHMLQEGRVPQSRCHALSERDMQLLPGLKARLAACPDWVAELEEMEGSGLKADIEALQHDDLMRQVQQAVLQGNYLH